MEEETTVDFDNIDINSIVGIEFTDCLKSMDNYEKERKKLENEYKYSVIDALDDTLSSYGKEVYNTFKEVLGGDNHNTNRKEMEQLKQMFDFILKYGSDVGMAEFTDQFNEEDRNNLFGMYQTFKEEIKKQDGAYTKILDEIDAMIPDIRNAISREGKQFYIKNKIDQCYNLFSDYNNERQSLINEFGDDAPSYTKVLDDFGSNIHNDLNDLLDTLSRYDLKVSLKGGNNLFVKIDGKENYVDLGRLETIFLRIKEFAGDHAMAEICDGFNAKKFGKDENFFDKINKFEINVIGQIGGTNIFDGINNTIIGIRQEFNGKNKEKDEFLSKQQENSVSLWQRFKNFFKKVFGGKNDVNMSIESGNNKQFKDATSVTKKQQNELGEGITKKKIKNKNQNLDDKQHRL